MNIKEKTQKILAFIFKPFTRLSSLLFKKQKKEEELDKNLIYSLSKSKIPNKRQFKHLGKFLNKKEKIVIIIGVLIILINLFYLAFNFYNKNWQEFPRSGGTYTEGLLGLPRYINPLYAIDRDIDTDLSYLIYSSLFKYNNQGEIVGDLVVDWEISEDFLEYTVYLKENVRWHNSEENLKADDVLFTFYLMKNPDFRSPWQRNLAGIELEKIDDFTLKFILQEPYAPFFELLTFGILPRFAWQTTNSDFILLSDLNLKPIGSGPYKFSSLTKNRAGEIKDYRLIRNENYYGNMPYIDELVFKFYFDHFQLVQALNDKEIDGAVFLPNHLKSEIIAKNSFNFNSLYLPHIKALFFNQEKDALKDKNIRRALAISLNRDKLIEEAMFNFAKRSDTVLPYFNVAYNKSISALPYDIDKARDLIKESSFKEFNYSDIEDEELKVEIKEFSEKNDLEKNTTWFIKDNEEFLYFSLLVPNTYQNKLLAELIKEKWEELGIKILINYFNSEEMQEKVINNQKFDILLQKQIIGSDPDISAFWHSSQINSGLNIISYQNSEVDSLLAEARKESKDHDKRIEKYHRIQEKVYNDLPAIFLFTSKYMYTQNNNLKGFKGEAIIRPSDRFYSISDWYVRTKKRYIK